MDHAQAPQVIRQILALVLANRCFTDVQVRPGQPLAVRGPRGYGREGPNVLPADVEAFAHWIDPAWQQRLAQGGGQFDAALTLGEHSRLRCNVFRCGPGNCLAVTVRWLPFRVSSPAQLGLPGALLAQVSPLRRGLLLVTGPTGSGKSTTLAALMTLVCRQEAAHLLSIEQPVEYLLEEGRGVITQREVPAHVPGFAAALEAARRQRPDVLMIGECRDRATVDTLLQAADSGMLVLGSLHARSAEEACQALLAFYSGDELQQRRTLLAAVLLSIACQVLTPSTDGQRLVLSTELLVNTPGIAALLRQGRFPQLENAVAVAGQRSDGSVLLNAALAAHVREGRIAYADALRDAYQPDDLQRRLTSGQG